MKRGKQILLRGKGRHDPEHHVLARASPMLLSFVPDTNVILAAARSHHHGESPNREILEAWKDGKILLLFSRDTAMEHAEKLLDLGWAGLSRR